jgi:hypothetical protein
MIPVRHRSHATYSRQPRQVRKEATVTGSCVCSEFPVPDFILFDSCFPRFRGFRSPKFTLRLPLFSQETSPLSIH